jgi:hypothetical protein
MLIDNVGAIFISPLDYPQAFIIFRCIGRLSLPIFLFLIVEGFYHTSNIQNYMKRLGIFALISEMPFDLAFYQYHFGTEFLSDFNSIFAGGYHDDKLSDLLINLFKYQNVFITLFLGLLLLYIMSTAEKKFSKNMAGTNMLNGFLTIAFCIAASFIRADYSVAGILTLVAFYLFRGNKLLIGIALFIVNGTIVGSFASDNLLAVIPAVSTLAIIPIAFYNGNKGKDIKYFFYIFYPAHLIILFLIRNIIW